MDAFKSFHSVPAAWLRDSDLAPFVPTYVRRLVDRHYAANTVRMYVYGVAHFAHLGGALFGFLLILYWRKFGSRL